MPNAVFKKHYFLFVLFFVSVSIWAMQQAPSEEFWNYMFEFDDDNGDVLDPLEYEQLLSIKDEDLEGAPERSSDKNMQKNAEANNQSAAVTSTHASSMQSSSSVMMKGESL